MKIAELCRNAGMEPQFILRCVRARWIEPVRGDFEIPDEVLELDEEDIARLHLIRELREDFGVNEEAVPVILHLIDQLHALQNHLRNKSKTTSRTILVREFPD